VGFLHLFLQVSFLVLFLDILKNSLFVVILMEATRITEYVNFFYPLNFPMFVAVFFHVISFKNATIHPPPPPYHSVQLKGFLRSLRHQIFVIIVFDNRSIDVNALIFACNFSWLCYHVGSRQFTKMLCISLVFV